MFNKKITVAYVSPGWPLSNFPNGIVTYIANLILGFNSTVTTYIFAQQTGKETAKDLVIDLSSFDMDKTITDKLYDAFIYRVSTGYAKKLQYDRTFSLLSKKILAGINAVSSSPDLLEIEESFGLGRLLVPRSKIPIVTRLHGPWFIHGPIMKLENDSLYKHRVECEGLGIMASHGVSSPSLDVLNRVREFYNIDLPNAVVIPNPVPKVPENLRWMGLQNNSQTLLFVGRFDLHKGGDLIINAFRMIAHKNHNVKLKFIGPDRGIPLNGKPMFLKDYLKNFVPEQEVRDRIEFLGHCDAKQIAHLRRESLITVIASRYENFGMSLLEALSTGCPVVATAIGGNKEIIMDNSNGLLAETDSAESICEKVLMLLDNPNLMLSLSKNAIETCNEKYSPGFVAKQTLEFYATMLNN